MDSPLLRPPWKNTFKNAKNAYKAITLYADEYNFDENDSVFILLLNAKW